MNDRPPLGVVGASSLVGGCVLRQLSKAGQPAIAFSRTERQTAPPTGIRWRTLQQRPLESGQPEQINQWIYLAPIWTLPKHFDLLASYGARRIVALSSTSRFTKQAGQGSPDPSEHRVAQELAEGEDRLRDWAVERGVEWVVLRPTLVYGLGVDKNVSEIARFIRRFGWFPLLGAAQGLRQPIHANDVALAALAVLQPSAAACGAYNIAGGETLTYKNMVTRIFAALHRPVRFVTIPLLGFRIAVSLLRLLPRYRHGSIGMATRMNTDLVFDCTAAQRDLGHCPKAFDLTAEDLPK